MISFLFLRWTKCIISIAFTMNHEYHIYKQSIWYVRSCLYWKYSIWSFNVLTSCTKNWKWMNGKPCLWGMSWTVMAEYICKCIYDLKELYTSISTLAQKLALTLHNNEFILKILISTSFGRKIRERFQLKNLKSQIFG